jgi:hypothetical protein
VTDEWQSVKPNTHRAIIPVVIPLVMRFLFRAVGCWL